jgi:hypothetical protein
MDSGLRQLVLLYPSGPALGRCLYLSLPTGGKVSFMFT